jgi:hypothetical protein
VYYDFAGTGGQGSVEKKTIERGRGIEAFIYVTAIFMPCAVYRIVCTTPILQFLVLIFSPQRFILDEKSRMTGQVAFEQ